MGQGQRFFGGIVVHWMIVKAQRQYPDHRSRCAHWHVGRCESGAPVLAIANEFMAFHRALGQFTVDAQRRALGNCLKFPIGERKHNQ